MEKYIQKIHDFKFHSIEIETIKERLDALKASESTQKVFFKNGENFIKRYEYFGNDTLFCEFLTKYNDINVEGTNIDLLSFTILGWRNSISNFYDATDTILEKDKFIFGMGQIQTTEQINVFFEFEYQIKEKIGVYVCMERWQDRTEISKEQLLYFNNFACFLDAFIDFIAINHSNQEVTDFINLHLDKN